MDDDGWDRYKMLLGFWKEALTMGRRDGLLESFEDFTQRQYVTARQNAYCDQVDVEGGTEAGHILRVAAPFDVCVLSMEAKLPGKQWSRERQKACQ